MYYRWTIAAAGCLWVLARSGVSTAQPDPPSVSHAEEQARWTGFNLSQVDGLQAARADGYTSGFTADFKGGLVRVYVLPTDAAASWWVARMARVVAKQNPVEVALEAQPRPFDASEAPHRRLDTAQEYLASGDRLVIARVDNAAVMVEVARGAHERAEAVLATLSDAQRPWPEVPSLERTGAGWSLPVPADTVVRYEGGQLGPGPGLRFSIPPAAIVIYDAHGRASRAAFDTLGLPIPSAEPWAEHLPTARTPPTPEAK